jgi:hypothetical protein
MSAMSNNHLSNQQLASNGNKNMSDMSNNHRSAISNQQLNSNGNNNMSDIVGELLIKIQSYKNLKLNKDQIFGIIKDDPLLKYNFQELRTHCLEKSIQTTESARVSKNELLEAVSKMGDPANLRKHHADMFSFFHNVIEKESNIEEQNRSIDRELCVIEAYKKTLLFHKNFKSGQSIQNFELIKEFFDATTTEAFLAQTDISDLEQFSKRPRIEESTSLIGIVNSINEATRQFLAP